MDLVYSIWWSMYVCILWTLNNQNINNGTEVKFKPYGNAMKN